MITAGSRGLVVFVMIFLAAGWARAQSSAPVTIPPAESAGTIVRGAAVSVTNIQATVGEDRTVRGTFTIINEGTETVGDIRTKIMLLGPAPTCPVNKICEDQGPLYIQVPGTETLAGIPGSVSGAYKPPEQGGGNASEIRRGEIEIE